MTLPLLNRGRERRKATRRQWTMWHSAVSPRLLQRGRPDSLNACRARRRAQRAPHYLPVTQACLHQMRSAGGKRQPVERLQTWMCAVLSHDKALEPITLLNPHTSARQLEKQQIRWRECRITETVEEMETRLSLHRASNRVSLYLSSYQFLQWLYKLHVIVFTTWSLTMLYIRLVYVLRLAQSSQQIITQWWYIQVENTIVM